MRVPGRARACPAASPFVCVRACPAHAWACGMKRGLCIASPRRALHARPSAAYALTLARTPDVLAAVCGLSLLFGTAGAYAFTHVYPVSMCINVYILPYTHRHAHIHIHKCMCTVSTLTRMQAPACCLAARVPCVDILDACMYPCTCGCVCTHSHTRTRMRAHMRAWARMVACMHACVPVIRKICACRCMNVPV